MFDSETFEPQVNLNGFSYKVPSYKSRMYPAGTFFLVPRNRGGWILWYTHRDIPQTGITGVTLYRIAVQYGDSPMRFEETPAPRVKDVYDIRDRFIVTPDVVRAMMQVSS